MSMAWAQERLKAARNEKGMTLIELLAVIVILGIIIAIAAVVIVGQFDKAKETSDAASARIITDAVQRYILENPDKALSGKDIEMQTLINEGYLKDKPVNSKKQTLEQVKVIYGKGQKLTVEFGEWYEPKAP
ncbi:MAG: prepilin-type N-terminal cleavage/methylation domain-containing protein [Paenibacillus dendritiformis]|uniref:prepilin-type N-terminal cleavage/methylation domain-containing protein n=1 Tax=Paenibacillus dendritiformis TaxID=130049 RepID=UPI001FF0AF12|nr:prepilin-type N-terminal cleavage/methylation domain-containing protein [Paenibacillus dendritiformis]MDU5143993.1 prepilin-type N-terminal cleavage/methylation domain-containing protein [Paenibacillus dendritiformis]